MSNWLYLHASKTADVEELFTEISEKVDARDEWTFTLATLTDENSHVVFRNFKSRIVGVARTNDGSPVLFAETGHTIIVV